MPVSYTHLDVYKRQLGTLRNVARASLICMMAGADFIKTSTGKEGVNATLPVSLTMIRCIRDYQDRTGIKVCLLYTSRCV